jgi:hypothetical protein
VDITNLDEIDQPKRFGIIINENLLSIACKKAKNYKILAFNGINKHFQASRQDKWAIRRSIRARQTISFKGQEDKHVPEH